MRGCVWERERERPRLDKYTVTCMHVKNNIYKNYWYVGREGEGEKRKYISAYVTVFVCVCGIAASSRVPKLQFFVTGSASGIDIWRTFVLKNA